MKKIIIFLSFLMLFNSPLFAISDKELAISINLAGKQRMLIKKITKEALLIHSNLHKEENIKNLKESSKLFDKTLKGLMSGDKSLGLVAIEDKSIQRQLNIIDNLWRPFHEEINSILSGDVKEEVYSFLEKHSVTLLREMNKAVDMYSSQDVINGKLKLANDINMAGKQRLLTQKMGKDLLSIRNNLNKKDNIRDFKKSRELFTKTINGLLYGNKKLKLVGTKVPKIVNQLNIVKNHWENMQHLLDDALKGKNQEEAITALDTLLVEMNKAVNLYTQSIERQKQRLRFALILSKFMDKNRIAKKRVNLSGRQRMLVQRMTKLALLISSNIKRESNTKKLIKYSQMYDKTLKAFREGDKALGCTPSEDKSIKEDISLVEEKWKPFYEHIQTIIDGKDRDKKALSYLIDKNEELLQVSDNLVKGFEKLKKFENYLEKSRVHIVNIAGRERMLSQKMTKEKLLIMQGRKEYEEKLNESIKLFDESLNALRKGDPQQDIIKPSNKKIAEQLNKVHEIWVKLKPLYEKEKPTTKELALIIKMNPILLKEMNKMVSMAEAEREY